MERRTVNPQVVGSNPSLGANSPSGEYMISTSIFRILSAVARFLVYGGKQRLKYSTPMAGYVWNKPNDHPNVDFIGRTHLSDSRNFDDSFKRFCFVGIFQSSEPAEYLDSHKTHPSGNLTTARINSVNR